MRGHALRHLHFLCLPVLVFLVDDAGLHAGPPLGGHHLLRSEEGAGGHLALHVLRLSIITCTQQTCYYVISCIPQTSFYYVIICTQQTSLSHVITCLPRGILWRHPIIVSYFLWATNTFWPLGHECGGHAMKMTLRWWDEWLTLSMSRKDNYLFKTWITNLSGSWLHEFH